MKLLFFILCWSGPALAYDAQCTASCMQQTTNYMMCNQRCNLQPAAPAAQPVFGVQQVPQLVQPLPLIDPACMQACNSRGLPLTYCNSKCSY